MRTYVVNITVCMYKCLHLILLAKPQVCMCIGECGIKYSMYLWCSCTYTVASIIALAICHSIQE
jgi:hypothetical protein